MKRRDFLLNSSAVLLTALIGDPLGMSRLIFPKSRQGLAHAEDVIEPLPEITAVVDILVPADPEIEGDFKGSDFGGDYVLAATLGDLGQGTAAGILNNYADQVHGKRFLECTPEEQMDALKQWVLEREDINPLFSELLTGVLTISVIGTFEVEDPEKRTSLFTSMGWFDPEDPSGTFRIPCEGYPDAAMFPVTLKKGLRK